MYDSISPKPMNWLERRTRVIDDLRRRSVAHLAAGGTTDMAPTALKLSNTLYTDPQRLAAEKREIFGKLPLVACLSGDIPNAGDVITFDLAGPPIVVTRGKDGQVHAFLNTCTHRGARLVRECGNRARLTCPFHGWTFDITGKLLGIPGKEGFPGMEHRDLQRVPVAEWNGLVFVQATPGDGRIDIEKYLGDFAPELAQLELANGTPVKSGILELKSNWKFALDTYGESYHFAKLHTTTIAPHFVSNVAAVDAFERGYRIYFPDVGKRELVGKPESAWPAHEFSSVHYLFPNTIVFVGSLVPGKWFYQIFRHFPGATPGEMRTHFTIYAPKNGADDAYRAEVAAAWDATAHVVQTEDYLIAAEGWDNLSRSPGATVVMGRNEPAVQHAQRLIAAAAGVPLPEVS